MLQKQYYSVKRAAQMFECSSEFLIKSIRAGRLPALRRKGRFIVDRYDLINYLKDNGLNWEEISDREGNV